MRQEEKNDEWFSKLKEVVWEQRRTLVQKGRNRNTGDQRQTSSHVFSSGLIPAPPPITCEEASEFNLTCFLGPGCVCLAKGNREEARRLCGSYLLAFLLIGTCSLSEWWVVEPQ